MTIRRWRFRLTDFDDRECFVGPDGGEIDELEVVPFIGTRNDALREGDCRADRWESLHGGLAARVTSESLGQTES